MRGSRGRERALLKTGIAGALVAGVLCLTPALVLVLGAVGLTAWTGWLDYVLLPTLGLFLALTAYAGVRLWRARREGTG